PGPLAAGLHLRPAAEQNHQPLAERLRIVVLAFLETISHSDDDHHRRQPPRNARHRQKTPQLVAVEAADHLAQQLAQVGHCRTTCWPSFRPLSTSVFAPLLMPSLTANFRLPVGSVASGISTVVERSLL